MYGPAGKEGAHGAEQAPARERGARHRARPLRRRPGSHPRGPRTGGARRGEGRQLVTQWSGRLPIIEADATNPDALEQLGAQDFSVVVVGVGTSLEASVLITANRVDMEVPQIWAKATSAEHGRILRRIGAHHVVYPEHDAGQRVAHMVTGRMLDYIEMEDGFTIVKMRPPRETQGF